VPTLSSQILDSVVTSIFEKAGAPSRYAQLVASHLVTSNLFGHDSHGVLRVPQYCSAIENGELIPTAEATVVHDSVSGAVLDGGMGFGQVAATEAMTLALSKAERNGTAAVTLRNCYHSGRLGAYTELAAAAGMIGIVMVNAGGGGQSVVPFGGSERRLATNPLSIAAPTGGEFPLVLDIATSMAPEGKIREYALRKIELPSGWIVDSAGRPSCDPSDFYGSPPGSLLPLGGPSGHKGFGLALMVDVLAGALSGAGCCQDEKLQARDGVLLIALNIAQFAGCERFLEHVQGLIEYVKSCPAASGFSGVYVPGEREFMSAQTRRLNGVPVDEDTWRQIEAIAERFEVPSSVDMATNGSQTRKYISAANVSFDGATI
jgi:uncharacterized oxidoreductase